MKNNLFVKIFIIILFLVFFRKVFALLSDSEKSLDFSSSQKTININDNGFEFEITSSENTVENLLKEKSITLSKHDQIIPDKTERVLTGTNIEIRRAVKIKIQVDGSTKEAYTLQKNIGLALNENGVKLGRLDKVSPDIGASPKNFETISVTRINVEEKVIPEEIDFKTTAKNDPRLGWREKKIEQKGEKGIKEIKYKITYKDGKEISRVVLEKNIVKDPIAQIETQGTYVKCGKANKGQATWYAYQGGMYAASTTIPKGGYAKVTNTASGKSVIVQINDYGPQGKGRVIDLDKVAFQKLASLGAGVIGVKVEEVLN
ncbi:MAG: hypothetical protein A2288_01935 [Candidatus Moranbacteria bacterium RIFOXYA12_FULL_44_15]|nr:MAG: hypothetical protein A2288_01935 [Candidatus Moranbacteria bacterium RIFOXYA12_FULL_44_15]OGI35462.1 MAG: hypothetical protein A2259_02440 [Candidatus Moranbacteria bacterium RIFOXYA2_FULL_43_15]